MDYPMRKESGQGRDKVLHYPCLSDELIHFSRGGQKERLKGFLLANAPMTETGGVKTTSHPRTGCAHHT